jgi:serine phosphatase RsbU (regulator of sigma subunit)
MKKAGAYLLSIYLLSCSILLAQKRSIPEIDSLLAKSERLAESSPDSMLKFAFKSAELSQSRNSPDHLARSYRAIGKAYGKLNELDNQISYFQKAQKIASTSSDEKLKTEITLSLAGAFFNKGKLDEAFLLFRKIKTSVEKSNDSKTLYEVYSWESSLFINDDNLDSAEYCYDKMLTIATANRDTSKIANAYRELSFINFKKERFDEGMKYSQKALELYTKINNIDGLARVYKDMGDVNWEKKNIKKSIEYYAQAYEIQKTRNNISRISIGACDLAYMYALDKRKDLLDKYGDEAYLLAQQTKSWSVIQYSSMWLSEAYEKIGDYKKALFYHKALRSINDSITNKTRIEKNSREVLESGFEEKVRNIKQEEEKRQAVAAEKENQQQMIRNILIMGFIIALVLLFIAFRSYVEKKKANVIVSRQKEEVEMQKQKIEEINKEMTDSINYAKIIQRSILPDPKEIMKVFPQSFGLYKPKSVVSGDFYWFTKKNDIAMIAAVDCTGHGVPGALMSMIGFEKLNEAVAHNLTLPAEILSQLNKGVKTTLKQKESRGGSQDGMDIALCCFDLMKNILRFSGAQRPLWIVRGNDVLEFKSSKVSIGGTTPDEQEFIAHEIQLQKGDSIYIFSDGFADQFGGSKGKKIMTKNFKETILTIQNVSFLEQEKILDKKLMEWQGNFEQVDDILVIGIRI